MADSIKKGETQVKIAVPTNDGLTMSEHFGRSAGFLIFEVQDGRIASRAIKENTMQHGHGQETGGHTAESAGAHNHAPILYALAGCDVVICAGMGLRAAEALKQGGIREVIFAAPGPADACVAAYLAGELTVTNQSFCRCSH
jgi:predicted Fe-Mo cluster-binding NifX family protein